MLAGYEEKFFIFFKAQVFSCAFLIIQTKRREIATKLARPLAGHKVSKIILFSSCLGALVAIFS